MSDKEYAIRQLSEVKARIAAAASQASRDPAEISLLGAAKQQTVNTVQNFVDAGLLDIGQNYLQESISVKPNVKSQNCAWHYIGQIQSNKTAIIAQEFDWVQSVERLKIARRLNSQRALPAALKVLIQVNIDNEASKSGAAPEQVPELVAQMLELTKLDVRGLMVLPRARQNSQEQRQPFAKTRELLERCNQRYGTNMDTLSMGMSGDLEAAILEGSTMVRIGTDLFGART